MTSSKDSLKKKLEGMELIVIYLYCYIRLFLGKTQFSVLYNLHFLSPMPTKFLNQLSSSFFGRYLIKQKDVECFYRDDKTRI